MSKNIIIFILAIVVVCVTKFDLHAQTDTTRQNALYAYLNQFRYPYGPTFRFNFRDTKREDYEVPKIKKRFLELLTKNWNEDEKEIYRKKYNTFNESHNKKETEKILKKDSLRTYKEVHDSISKVEADKMIEDNINSYQISSELIKLAGKLDMQEAIPYLEAILKDPKHYDKEVARLSLARLRVEPYYSEVLAECQSSEIVYGRGDIYTDIRTKADNLLFLASQESIYAFRKLLEQREKYDPYHGHGTEEDYQYIVAYPTAFLFHFIQDEELREYVKEKELYAPFSVTLEDIIYMQEWLEEHKGNISFDRYFHMFLK